jgi:(4S)-4-hydroxy-5-phosphonooxypentane-2,3-dione isomerase
MAYTLVARMTTREGEEERAAQLVRRLGEASRQEPGVIHYIAHRDSENERVFLIYEQYRDKAAFEAHGQTEHFKEIAVAQLFPLMEKRERNFYDTLD